MRLRRGDYSHIANLDAIEVQEHTQFLGFFIAGVSISFLITWFVLGGLQTLLFLPIIWKTLWDLKWAIVSILITPII
jgi:hypothetical protein